MILTINTALFYECLSRYLSWFNNISPEYAAYINSTINAGSIIFTESFDINTRLSLFTGYLINDTVYLLCKTSSLSKHKPFLIHHILSIALTISSYPQRYPEITRQLLIIERTIPLANAIWFLKHHYPKPSKTISLVINILKGLFFLAYSYYRVIHLPIMSYNC